MPGDTAAASLKRHAAERLDLPPGAFDVAVRARICRHLAAADFLPDPTLHEAILIAAGWPVDPTGSLVAAAAEAAIHRAVEEFANDFFAIPIPARQARWQALRAEAEAFPRVVARLDQLRPGLTFEPGSITAADPRAEWLANDLMNLFIASAAVRPAWMREMVARLHTRPRVWWAARLRIARLLHRVAPALTVPARDFLDQIRPSGVKIGLVAIALGLLAILIGLLAFQGAAVSATERATGSRVGSPPATAVATPSPTQQINPSPRPSSMSSR